MLEGEYKKNVYTLMLLSSLLCACGGAVQVQSTTNVPSASQSSPLTTARVGQGLIVGYQGWFGCPGDFEDNQDWVHWFSGAPGPASLLVDMFPDTAGLPPPALCDTGLRRNDGTALQVFSSQHPAVTDYHFGLMAQNHVGAVALQRFVTELQVDSHVRRVDNVLANVLSASQKYGVPFFISYDVSGADPNTVTQVIRADLKHLMAQFDVANASTYLHTNGKPVLQVWGFGIIDHPGTPAQAASLLDDLKSGSAGFPSSIVVGGVASHWRTLDQDSQSDPEWLSVYLSFDVLSPWTVGRYASDQEAMSYYAEVTAPDLSLTKAKGIGYLPVIFPGFSWRNLMTVRREPSMAILNQIPRSCGDFLRTQAHLLAQQGVGGTYLAMFDELDEATAMVPAVTQYSQLPEGAEGVYLDIDGCQLASDAYTKMIGEIAQSFSSQSILASTTLP
jgi:hypothetical protein